MKQKNYFVRASVFLIVVILFRRIPVQAKWIITPNEGETTTTDVSGIATREQERVAYIEGDTDEIGFTSIEAALAKATEKGGSQKVVVAKSSIINHDCQISTGVELRIPYSDTETTFKDPSGESITNCGSSAPSTLKYNVTLNANLVVYGQLTVRGQYGGTSGTFTSHSFGVYSQLTLSAGRHITVGLGGAIRCFGFIKENLKGYSNYIDGNKSYIEVLSGGSVWEPLTVYDWPGGKGASERAIVNKVFPFQQFDRPNIYPPIRIDNGGSLFGQIQITTSMGNVNKKIPAISASGSLINLTAGNITWDYGRKTENQNRESNRVNHLTKVISNGSASLGSISVSLSIATIDSADFSIPRGPQFSVCVESGNFTLGNRSHWFGGNNRIVKKDGRVTITADTAVFDDVSVINNGVLSISGAIGGKVITGVKGSTLAIGKSTSITGKYLENGNVVKKTFTAIGYLSDNATNLTQLKSNSIYESSLMTNKPSDGYWAKNDNLYLIRYNLNEHVTVSASVKSQMSQQRTRKYYDGAKEIQIVNPQDSELKRSYTTTTISGEGDNLTATTEEHSGYATFQGWNTDFYGAGKSITPGATYSFSSLANQTGSHLIRLYDKWVGNEITIHFTHDEGLKDTSVNKRDDVNSNACIGWRLPKCKFLGIKFFGLGHSFDHWEISSPDGKTVFLFSAETYILLDESIVDPTQNGFVLNVKAISK